MKQLRTRKKTTLLEKAPFHLSFFIPVLIMIGIFVQRGIFPFGDNSFLPVSYTHLDVYKRQALKDQGCQLPDDCSIVGIDDISFSSICSPPLTSVRIPCKDLGAQAIQLLHYKLEHPDTAPTKILLDGELIVRGSAAVPAASNN